MSTSRQNSVLMRAIVCAAALSGSAYAAADPAPTPTPAAAPVSAPADPATVAMRQSLQQRYPNTKFGDIQRTPLPGVWEVWMGANIAFVGEDGRYFLFGHLYDMQTQTDRSE